MTWCWMGSGMQGRRWQDATDLEGDGFVGLACGEQVLELRLARWRGAENSWEQLTLPVTVSPCYSWNMLKSFEHLKFCCYCSYMLLLSYCARASGGSTWNAASCFKLSSKLHHLHLSTRSEGVLKAFWRRLLLVGRHEAISRLDPVQSLRWLDLRSQRTPRSEVCPRNVQGAQGDAARIQNASKTHQQHSVPKTGDIWCENFSILRSAPQDIRSQKARPSAVSLDLSPGNVEGKMTYRWVHYRHKTRLMTHIIGVTFSTCVARLARTCTAGKKTPTHVTHVDIIWILGIHLIMNNYTY